MSGRAHPARGATQASTSAGLGVVNAWENYGGEPESCKILGKCSPGRLEESQATFRSHLSYLDARLQPDVYTGFALFAFDTVGCPAASAFHRSDRQCREAPGAHVTVQSSATTVGQLGGQLQSIQAEVTEIKTAENEDGEFEEHNGFSTTIEEGGVAVVEAQVSQHSIPSDMRRTESPRDDLVIRVRGRSCLAACHAIEISSRPSPCRCGKARGQEEDEMAPAEDPVRVAPYTAVRVGEASHPGSLFTKHLPCAHCSTWLTHHGSLRKHIQRFHESPPSPPPLS